jgi:dephospho-CoA kinase
MRIIGLTGGIASGKSTVARLFAAHGAQVFSADEDARAVLAPGSPTLTQVLATFPDCRNPEGTLNRSCLAARIFADPVARQQLEAIMHPAIFERMQEAIQKARTAGPGVLLYEVPLLYEKQREGQFEAIVATLSSPTVQAERLQQREIAAGRPPLTEEAIAERFAAQFPSEEKARRADYVIRTDVPLEDTEHAVTTLWKHLTASR